MYNPFDLETMDQQLLQNLFTAFSGYTYWSRKWEARVWANDPQCVESKLQIDERRKYYKHEIEELLKRCCEEASGVDFDV